MSQTKSYKRPDVKVFQDFDNALRRKAPFTGSPGRIDTAGFISAFSRDVKKREVDIYDLLNKLASGGKYMGKSAYEIWLDQGNEGTVQEFLDSLVGADGKSAYEIWLELGNVGTKGDFIQSLIGTDGKSAYEIWLEQGNTGDPDTFIAYLQAGRLYWQRFDQVEQVHVNHNMHRYPVAYVIDDELSQCEVQVKHIDESNLIINMNGLQDGWVYCV